MLKRKYGLLIGSDLPAGSIWLCEGCHSKNNHLHKHTVSTTPIPNPEDNAPVVDPPQETSICKEYIHGKCKHGINGNKVFDGDKCKFLHPKRCIKFCKYGSSHRLGCNYGMACRWFHPILCRYAVQHGVCSTLNVLMFTLPTPLGKKSIDSKCPATIPATCTLKIVG